MEGIVGNILNVLVYFNDILVTGSSEEVNLYTLELVLSCLEAAGLRLKLSKCSFMLSNVEYLGHKISAEGIQPKRRNEQSLTPASTESPTAQIFSRTTQLFW